MRSFTGMEMYGESVIELQEGGSPLQTTFVYS